MATDDGVLDQPAEGVSAPESPMPFSPELTLEGKRFAPRALAFLIDVAVLYGLTIGSYLALPLLLGQSFAVRTAMHAVDLRENPLPWPELLLGFVTSTLYFSLFEWLHGATPGKMLLRMRVARTDGGRLGFRPALVRGLLRVVDSFLFALPAAANMKPPLQQRIGDKVAKSVVTGSRDPCLRFRRGWGWAALALVLFLLFGGGLRFGLVQASAQAKPAGDRYAEQAILAQVQGDHTRAAELYEQAIDAGLPAEQLPATWFLTGNAYLQAGQPYRAIEAHQTSVALDPEFTPAWIGLGNAYRALGDLEQAYGYTEHALTLAPEDAVCNLNLGIVWMEKTEPARALPYLDRAQELDPTLAAAPAWKVWAYVLLERYAEADAALEQARDLGFPNWEELQRQIELYKAGSAGP